MGSLLLFASANAWAQGERTNAATAQLLFDEAKTLLANGDIAKACAKFSGSHRLDPSGGTILHAADCHEREGKLATAWSEYNEALSFANRDHRVDRAKVARTQIDLLAPKLARMTFALDPETRDLPDLHIELDAHPVPREAWGAPVPVDSGTHTIAASAPGRVSFTMQLSIEDGTTPEARIPSLARVPDAPPQAVMPLTTSTLPPPEPTSDGSPRRTMGLVVGGVGVVGLVVGSVFGVRAMSIGDQSHAAGCVDTGGTPRCPQSRVDDQNSARASGTVSTVSFIAGGALAVAGAVLYFTAPKGTRLSVSGSAGPSIALSTLF